MRHNALEIQALRRTAVFRIAVQDQILHLARKFLEGGVQIEAVRRRRNPQSLLQIRRAGAGAETSFKKRLAPIDDYLRWIKLVVRAEAVAFGTSAIRRVKAERTRLKLRYRDAAVRARQLLRIDVFFAPDNNDGDQSTRQFERGLDGLLQTLRDAALQQHAVDENFNCVILAAVERRRLVEIYKLTIDARADVTVLLIFLELFPVFAFAAAHDRSEHHNPVVRLERQDRLDNLFGRLACDRLAAVRAMGCPNRAVDDAQIVVDFGDRANGRSRRASGRLLFDRNRRGQPFDRVHFRTLHLVEKLARIGRKRLNVTALPFGVEG